MIPNVPAHRDHVCRWPPLLDLLDLFAGVVEGRVVKKNEMDSIPK